VNKKEIAKKLLATTKGFCIELYELEKAICFEPNENLKVYQNIYELNKIILLLLGVHENYLYKNYDIFDLNHYLIQYGIKAEDGINRCVFGLNDYLNKYYNDAITEDEVINFYSQDVFSVYGLDKREESKCHAT
jgi:hypothetical protein